VLSISASCCSFRPRTSASGTAGRSAPARGTGRWPDNLGAATVPPHNRHAEPPARCLHPHRTWAPFSGYRCARTSPYA
jgi:hypothetical protein